MCRCTHSLPPIYVACRPLCAPGVLGNRMWHSLGRVPSRGGHGPHALQSSCGRRPLTYTSWPSSASPSCHTGGWAHPQATWCGCDLTTSCCSLKSRCPGGSLGYPSLQSELPGFSTYEEFSWKMITTPERCFVSGRPPH